MSYFNAVIEDKAAFERALDTPLTVFILFASKNCHACNEALPWFKEITDAYQRKIKVLILDCEDTPRHPAVKRIPTLLIYQKGQQVRTVEGITEAALLEALIAFA
jgi:thioredoxin 1